MVKKLALCGAVFNREMANKKTKSLSLSLIHTHTHTLNDAPSKPLVNNFMDDSRENSILRP